MLISLAARPRSPSAAAIRSKSVPRPPGPRSVPVPVPATRPPGGFPQPIRLPHEFTSAESVFAASPPGQGSSPRRRLSARAGSIILFEVVERRFPHLFHENQRRTTADHFKRFLPKRINQMIVL